MRITQTALRRYVLSTDICLTNCLVDVFEDVLPYPAASPCTAGVTSIEVSV